MRKQIRTTNLKRSAIFLLFLLACTLFVAGCSLLNAANSSFEVTSLKAGTAIDTSGVLSGEATSFKNASSLVIRGTYTYSGAFDIVEYRAQIYINNNFYQSSSINNAYAGTYNGQNAFAFNLSTSSAGNYYIKINKSGTTSENTVTAVTGGEITFVVSKEAP